MNYHPFLFALALILLSSCGHSAGPGKAAIAAPARPSFSGLAWVEGEVFIGVHDAKGSAQQIHHPRLSMVHLQEDAVDVQWYTFNTQSKVFKVPSDLESISTLPQGQGFLLAESGQDPDPQIYHVTYEHGVLTTRSQVPWPVAIENVEASEIFAVGQQWYFIYAERAKNQPSTRIRWAPCSITPLQCGAFQETTYTSAGFNGENIRPISAMAIDKKGHIYIASTYDPGGSVGPFKSVIRRIGVIAPAGQGNVEIHLYPPVTLATLDAVKVEGLAIRETGGQGVHLYIGTDDEDFGGIVRPLPVLPRPDR